MRGWSTLIEILTEGARARLRRFGVSKKPPERRVSVSFTRSTREKITGFCAAPLAEPALGWGYPTSYVSFREGARARLRRVDASKNCQNRRSVRRQDHKIVEATHRKTNERVRGTLPLPHPSPRERSPTSGGRGSAKMPEDQGLAIRQQQDVPYYSPSRACKSARAGWGTPPPSLISPRDPAHASGGSGSAKISEKQGQHHIATGRVRGQQ